MVVFFKANPRGFGEVPVLMPCLRVQVIIKVVYGNFKGCPRNQGQVVACNTRMAESTKKRLILSSDSKPDWGLFVWEYHVCVTREGGIVHVFSGGFTPVAQETATTVVCG